MLKVDAAVAHLTVATRGQHGPGKVGATAELVVWWLSPRHVVGNHSVSQTHPTEEALSPLAHERIAHEVHALAMQITRSTKVPTAEELWACVPCGMLQRVIGIRSAVVNIVEVARVSRLLPRARPSSPFYVRCFRC